jgi:hypothetical protein
MLAGHDGNQAVVHGSGSWRPSVLGVENGPGHERAAHGLGKQPISLGYQWAGSEAGEDVASGSKGRVRVRFPESEQAAAKAEQRLAVLQRVPEVLPGGRGLAVESRRLLQPSMGFGKHGPGRQ